MAEQRGWRVERFEQPVSGDVLCITMNPESSARPITFSGHMDTVHPVGSFGTPAVHRDTEKIYGPGVTDCKGGVVAAVFAMDVLHRYGFTSRPIQLLLSSDEEVGSRYSQKATIRYICERAQNSLAFFNMEGHTAGEACLQRKGIITFLFTVHGVEAHASKCANLGANAIAEAAHKILEIEKFKDAEGVTCCTSVISGGTTVNTVPGQCEFRVNVRFATAEQKEWICDYMQTLADTVFVAGCKTNLEQVSYRAAMEYSAKNIELLETVNRGFAESGLPLLATSKRTGGSDAADITALGIPCLDSMGVRGGDIHTSCHDI